jgi:serine/threonine protein kinase
MIGSIVEDRYLVEAELGTGAMGRVFAARHVKVGRRVAIKVMHDELAQNPMVVERFAREAMVAARLRHPNLVSVLDVGQTATHQPLLVLELAPGVPLTHFTCEALSGPRVVNLIRQLLRGLSHAHAAGLIHRDLKPDNILVETTADGIEIPRIVDFGIAVTACRDDSTIAGRRLTDANMVIGTPFYMSPEQARAKDIDHRTDLFSLGVIMYELLAGMPPFPGTSIDVALANASKDAPTIAERAGIEVDPLLEAFMRRLMARRLEMRFQTAQEALDVLALIEIDRMAAARVLGGSPLVDVPRPVLAQGSAPHVLPQAPAMVSRPNSDEMTTITEATPDAPSRDASSTDDVLDYDPAVSLRRRKRVALGFIAAAVVAIAFFAMRPAATSEAPTVELATQAQDTTVRPAHVGGAKTTANVAAIIETAPAPVVEKQVEQPVAKVGAPSAAPVVEKTVRKVDKVVAPKQTAAKVVAPKTLATKSAAPITLPRAESSTAVMAEKPAITIMPAAAPAIPATVTIAPTTMPPANIPATDSVDVLVAKYQAVAKKLKAQPASPATDDLWMRFRLIRINESMATQHSRRQALALLAAIEKAIR